LIERQVFVGADGDALCSTGVGFDQMQRGQPLGVPRRTRSDGADDQPFRRYLSQESQRNGEGRRS